MFALIPIFFTLGPIAFCQATAPLTAEQERLAEIQRIEAELAEMPKVEAASVDQVMRFGVEQKMLAVRTSLKLPSNDQVHVKVPELRGYVRFGLIGPQDDPDAAGRNFSFLQQDLSGAQGGQVYTSVSAIAGQLIVSRDSEDGRFTRSVQIVQDAPRPPGELPTPGADDPVRLLVHIIDGAEQQKEIDLKLSAPDFVQLRREHGREVDKYLRPILRDLGQEAALFGVQPQVAWQVLGTNFVPDEKLVSRVSEIIKRLDADSFKERQAALAELKHLGEPAAFVLTHMDRSKLTLQQSDTIESFLVEFAPLSPEEIQQRAADKDFLLDVLFNDDIELRKLALERLSKACGRKIELDPKLDPAARADAVAKLRNELIPATQPAPP